MKYGACLRRSLSRSHSLVDNYRLVCGHKVLDVDEGVLPSIDLELLEGLSDQLSKISSLPLRVVYAIAEIVARVDENIHNGQNLTVIGH